MIHIPVAYAIDNSFQIMLVSITSLLLRAEPDVFYDIYILVDHEFDKENEVQEALAELVRGKARIEFKNVGNRFEKTYKRYDFISNPTYFRLALPDLLTEKKCIYLDMDTIICRDLKPLYDVDITGQYLAGVKAPYFHIREDAKRYCRQALLPSLSQYINAGVLLMNLEEMRKYKLSGRFQEYLKYDMECQDQDILNSCCYGKIKFLPFHYNVMTKYGDWQTEDYKGHFSEDELLDAWNNPSIIHYADRIKPWNEPESCLAEYWWRECRRNPSAWSYYTEKYSIKFLVKTIYHAKPANRQNSIVKLSRIPKLFELREKRKLVVYGAGVRAKELLAYLAGQDIVPDKILVKDKNGNPEKMDQIQVIPLSEIEERQTDTALLIATRESLHEEIMEDIERYGFGEILLLNDDWKGGS